MDFRKLSAVLFVAALIMSIALAGCGGGGGGLSSALGGGAGANHPIVGGTVQAYIGGDWVNVTTTNANGILVGFDPAAKITTPLTAAGEYYPVIMRIAPNTGTIKGIGGTYAGELKTVVDSEPTNVYFSLLTTMVANLYDAKKADFPTTAAAIDYANGRVQAIIASFGLTPFNPLTTNPYTSFDSALVQAALWSGYGLDFSDGEDSSSVDAMVSAVTTQLKNDATSPATALQNALPKVAAQMAVGGRTAAQGLEAFIDTVKADTNIAYGLATSYNNSEIGTSQSAVQTTLNNTTTSTDTQMKNFVGELHMTTATTVPGVSGGANGNDYTLLATDLSGSSITWVVTVKDAAGNNFPAGNDVVATLSNPNIGIFSGSGTVTETEDLNGTATVDFQLDLVDLSALAGESFTVTFAITKNGITSQLVATGIVQVAGDVPTGISLNNGGDDDRLLLINSGNSYTDPTTYTLTATVNKLGGGAFTADTINVNFLAPSGIQFKVGTDKYSNYMVTVATNTASKAVQFAGDDTTTNGVLGAVTAEVWNKGGGKISPTMSATLTGASATTKDFWAYTGTAVSDIRRIDLKIDGATSLQSTGAGNVDLSQAGNGPLALAFITWDGDPTIDDQADSADNIAAIGAQLLNKRVKLYTDAPSGAGFEFANSQYGNLEIQSLVTANITNAATDGNGELTFINANLNGIADDTPFSGYNKIIAGNTDNMDVFNVKIFDSSTAYSGTYNKSSDAVLRLD